LDFIETENIFQKPDANIVTKGFMIELNKIYNEDCIETMKRMPDDFVNLVITSPPYNMNLRIHYGKYIIKKPDRSSFCTKYKTFSDALPIEEFYELHSKILQELLRVSELVFYNIQIVTGSKRAFFKIIGNYSDYLKDIIIWDKNNAQPAMSENVLNRRSELLVFDKKNAISRKFDIFNCNRGSLDDVWNINRERSVTSEHSATFPEELVSRIITIFSNENDIIYDPFMGTGTTARSALENNRRFVGSEISDEYFDVIEERLNVVTNFR
jgi:site-specific DNA-methyltransferase (adenine-specific)/modification methylase